MRAGPVLCMSVAPTEFAVRVVGHWNGQPQEEE